MYQINRDDNFKIRPIKIENLKKNYLINSLSEDEFLFFCEMNEDQFNVKWALYDEEEQSILDEAFQKYLKCKTKNIVYINYQKDV